MTKVRKNFTDRNFLPVRSLHTVTKGFVLTLLIVSVNVVKAEKQTERNEANAGSTSFFEHTNPDNSESRFVPQSTYRLNAKFAVNYSKALDKVGSFYYTDI